MPRGKRSPPPNKAYSIQSGNPVVTEGTHVGLCVGMGGKAEGWCVYVVYDASGRTYSYPPEHVRLATKEEWFADENREGVGMTPPEAWGNH